VDEGPREGDDSGETPSILLPDFSLFGMMFPAASIVTMMFRDHRAHDWRAGVAQRMGHQQPLELLGRRRQRRQPPGAASRTPVETRAVHLMTP
jgi:hypothetical protein